jgi:23S rRNA pseudouridine2605 synthase
MAAAGLGSRRALEKHIAAGVVTVDGRPATLGQSVGAGAIIGFAERKWRVANDAAAHRTLVYNKPEGEVTTRADPEGRPTVFDRLPPVEGGRWIAIGRLDFNTTGLLLLTTDGELANTMMHPSGKVDREYACRIRGKASPEQLERLRQGVELEDGPARFSDIQEGGGKGENHWYEVTLLEGRNREVRRLWESQGLTVSRLKRVRYGGASLPPRLRMGHWSEITPREHGILREDVGLPRTALGLVMQELKTGRTGPAGKPARPGAPGRRTDQPGKRADQPGRRADQPGRRADKPSRRADQPGRRVDKPSRRADQPGRRKRPAARRDKR